MTSDCWGELAFFSELRDLIANKQNISPPPSLTIQQQDYIVSDGIWINPSRDTLVYYY